MARTFLTTIALSLLSLAVSCAPQSESSGTSTSDSEGSAATSGEATPEALIQKVIDQIASAQTVSVDLAMNIELEIQGQIQKAQIQQAISVKRPNQLAVRGQESDLAFDVLSDGKTLVTYVPALKKYSEEPAPKTLEEVIQNPLLINDPLLLITMRIPMGNLSMQMFADNSYDLIMQNVLSSEDLGNVKLDGQTFHHLKFHQELFDWEAWITTDAQPLLHRVSFDLAKLIDQHGGLSGQEVKFSTEQNYRNWKFNEAPNEETFAFIVPDDAEKTDDLFGGSAERELSPLLGKPAPTAELPLLDGSEFKLSSHLGKDVVILDFWATWCGPCVRVMPTLEEIANEYKARGVKLYSVNQREDAETISRFLAQQEINVTVALDSEGKVGDAFGVMNFPTMVIVDQQGVVQAVNVGVSQDTGRELRAQLDDILAGKDLAAEAIKAREERAAAKKDKEDSKATAEETDK